MPGRGVLSRGGTSTESTRSLVLAGEDRVDSPQEPRRSRPGCPGGRDKIGRDDRLSPAPGTSLPPREWEGNGDARP